MLAIAMVLCVLVSCKKDGQDKGNSDSSATSVEDGGRLGELGSRDFEGKSFNKIKEITVNGEKIQGNILPLTNAEVLVRLNKNIVQTDLRKTIQ